MLRYRHFKINPYEDLPSISALSHPTLQVGNANIAIDGLEGSDMLTKCHESQLTSADYPTTSNHKCHEHPLFARVLGTSLWMDYPTTNIYQYINVMNSPFFCVLKAHSCEIPMAIIRSSLIIIPWPPGANTAATRWDSTLIVAAPRTTWIDPTRCHQMAGHWEIHA